MTLAEYVKKHARRGGCRCGRCIDAPERPDEAQPAGHTVNLTFFDVSIGNASKDEFLALVRAEHPEWLDGKEHGYIEIGVAMGDQGLALMTIGLGHLVGAWTALSPDTILPFLSPILKLQMAGRGMVSLKTGGLFPEVKP